MNVLPRSHSFLELLQTNQLLYQNPLGSQPTSGPPVYADLSPGASGSYADAQWQIPTAKMDPHGPAMPQQLPPLCTSPVDVKPSVASLQPTPASLQSTPEMDEKERHKVRQRVRRNKINNTLATLKSLIPECNVQDSGKKKKIDQTKLLEMTVAYIQQLQAELNAVRKQNEILLGTAPPVCGLDPTESAISFITCSEDGSSDVFSDDGLAPSSSPMPTASEPSSPERDPHLRPLEPLPLEPVLCGKRSLSDLYDSDTSLDGLQGGRPFKMVSGARMVLCLFLFSLLLYNPLSSPAPALAVTASPGVAGRVVQSLAQPTASATTTLSWLAHFTLSVLTKSFMLLMWVFAALLLDHADVASDEKVALAKRENDKGIKKFDRGDYDESRRHFQRALAHLGHHAPFYFTTRLFHIPLELVRQVTHLLRIGLWCDGFLVRIRGGQPAMLEVARAHHHLFTLNVLANTMDTHSVLHFLISLNAAESLYQKPPLLAEVYATVGLALYGLCSMPTAYKHFLAKAWEIVDTNMDNKASDDSCSVDSTIAYLLFLSSYGTLCEGNLKQAEAQIVESTNLFLKKGKDNMWKYGQFLLAYTSFLRGDYHRSIKLIQRTNLSSNDDPRILWWKEVILACCKLGTGDALTKETLALHDELYAKVEVHLSLVPAMELLHNSVQAYMLLHMNERDQALKAARKALGAFVNSTFSGWIFYCGYYIGEVFFARWTEEKARGNKEMVDSLEHSCRLLCDGLRRIASQCELARPVSLLAEGQAASLRDDHELASQYFQRAAVYAGRLEMPMYQVQAEDCMKREMRIVCQQNKQAQLEDSLMMAKLPVWDVRRTV